MVPEKIAVTCIVKPGTKQKVLCSITTKPISCREISKIHISGWVKTWSVPYF